MKLMVAKTVNVPVSPWCGNCYRKEYDKNDMCFCTLHNHFLFIVNGHYLKCRECYITLYNALEMEAK